MAILASILDVCWRSLVASTVRESVAVEFEPRCGDSDLLPVDWDYWTSGVITRSNFSHRSHLKKTIGQYQISKALSNSLHSTYDLELTLDFIRF